MCVGVAASVVTGQARVSSVDCATLNGRRKSKYITDSRPSRKNRMMVSGLWIRTVIERATIATISCTSTLAFWPVEPVGSRPYPRRIESFDESSRMLVQMSTFVELDVSADRIAPLCPPIETSANKDWIPSDGFQQDSLKLVSNQSESYQFSQSTNTSIVAGGITTENRIQFKGVSSGPQMKNNRKKLRISERRGRIYSSTMPGFGAESDRLKAYRDGIRLAEVESGRKSTRTSESEHQRKKQCGEALYRNSAAVPDSLIRFADDIHREERISRKEEIQLGELTQEAVRLQQLYERLKDKLQREPTDNEWCAAAGKINMMAIEQAIQDGFAAKNRLVASNLRIVQSVVNIYLRNGLSAQYNAGDMMQEGILALIRAAEKFEPDRGWKFSTYAMYWVRASIKRDQVRQSRSVPVPHRVYENHKRLLRTQRKLELALHRKPTKRELAEAVGMTEIQVERCFKAMQQKFYSLDQEILNTKKPQSANQRNDRLIEIVEAKVVDDEFSLKSLLLREAFVETLRRHLNAQEVESLMLRYGLKECPGHAKISGQATIAEISRHLNLTPDKVRRIIKKALKQLQDVDPDEWLVFKQELC